MSAPKEDGAAGSADCRASELEMPPDAMRELAARRRSSSCAASTGLAGEPAWRGASRAELEPLLREPPPEEGAARPGGHGARRAGRPSGGGPGGPSPLLRLRALARPRGPGVLADFLAAGFNTFQGTWLGSGGPSQLELVVTDWFRDWVGYPETAGGLFTRGGSAASLDALVAAREAAGAPERPAVYMSDQSHRALERAARIVGRSPGGRP